MNDIELYDLYDVWYQPWWHHWAARAAGILLLVLCIAVILWVIFRRVIRPKVEPFWQIALAQCAALKHQMPDLPLPVIYVRMTNILKTYIATRYARTVSSATDHELTQLLDELAICQEQKSKMQELLVQAVPAKFAHTERDMQAVTRDIADLEHFINETRPVEPSKTTA